MMSSLVEQVLEHATAIELGLSVGYSDITEAEYRGLIILRAEKNKYSDEKLRRERGMQQARDMARPSTDTD